LVTEDGLPQPRVHMVGQSSLQCQQVEYMDSVINEEADRSKHHPEVRVIGGALNEPSVLNTEAQGVNQNADERPHRVESDL